MSVEKVSKQGIYDALIPDALCEKAHLTISWSGELKFGLHACEPNYTKGTDRASSFAPCDPKIHHLRIDSVLFHPISRKLVAESNGFFLYGQKLGSKPRSGDFPLEILKISRQYRSVLRECLVSFQLEADAAEPALKDQFLQFIPIFYNMELIWHLAEILFIDVLPGHLVLAQLVSWIRFHVPHVEKEAIRLLTADDDNVHLDESYWPVVIDCLLQRRIDTVRALLKRHPDAGTDAFIKLDQLLHSMPIFDLYQGLSAVEFQVRYDHWRREASRIHRSGLFSVHSDLDTIVKIIIGDDYVEDLVRKHCETWYQHLVASLIYTCPTVKIFDLSFHANRSINLYGGPESISPFDWILCAVMEMDIFKMVDKLLEWNHSNWLLAHLIHLLHLLGKLSSSTSTEPSGAKLCEKMLIDYGCLMMSHKSLWQVGIDYLDHCSTEGKAHLENLLSRIPFRTNDKALKIMNIANERGFYDISISVAKVQGLRFIQRGELGSALSWAIRSKDPVFCSQLADLFLKDYVREKRFQAVDLLENLGIEMMFGDRLVFLGKYCEFLRLLRTGDFREAASLLVSLLNNRVVPNYFWLTVFIDAMPIIKSETNYFAPSEIIDLMSFLQELVDSDTKVAEDTLKEIRKSLAMALTCEGSYNL